MEQVRRPSSRLDLYSTMRELKEFKIQLDQIPVSGINLQGILPPQRLTRLGGAVTAIPEPIEVDFHLRPAKDVFLLSGRVTGRVTLACQSCSKEYSFQLTTDLVMPVDPNPRGSLREPTEKGEEWVIEQVEEQIEAPGGILDLLAALEDEWILELPISPRCSPDCGISWREAEYGRSEEVTSSPFSVLAQLKKDK